MLEVTVKGLTELQRGLKAYGKRQEKALNTAVRVEGFRLKGLLQREIRQGAPGGRPFAPLSEIAKKRKRSSKPLNRLAIGVRYVVERSPFAFKFGWTGPGVSKSWKRLAEMHQRGFTRPVSDEQRRLLKHWGAGMGKGTRARKYFFLRGSTTEMRTPARPILDPFWLAYHDVAWRNIQKNFRRKMAGERI